MAKLNTVRTILKNSINVLTELVSKGLAYVCFLTAEEAREYRGTLKEPGINSPYRDTPIEENLGAF